VHNEQIAVQVLNGKDGHPQAQTRVVLTAGYDRRDLKLAQWREEVLTDSAGMVRLSNALRNLPLLEVEVVNRHRCAPRAETVALSGADSRKGMTGANRCGTAVVENAPGVFTVFVKAKKGASKARTLSAPPPPLGPDSTSVPLHFRVRPATPALARPQAPMPPPAEEDLNSLCEPG
jgi:hypothetical protein